MSRDYHLFKLALRMMFLKSVTWLNDEIDKRT